MREELKKIEQKWKQKWAEAKLFEAKPLTGKKKFFGTFPYPYVNSYLHLGHFYTSMRLEAFSRYKRMRGYNVLYAQGWHCTGSPIVSAAKRIAEHEPTQTDIMRKQGFNETEIVAFADPEAWIRYFPGEGEKDFSDMGFSIDWRRQFITTSLNPHYDAFIRWQFNTLHKKGYVLKGKFPVVWDPIDNAPVGDHDRVDGEGETPQEYVLVKHQLGNTWIVSATLRPDTIMGVTNLYINPEAQLVEAEVNGELWILSEKAARELSFQDKNVKIVRPVLGRELIGKKVLEFSKQEVLILPAPFVDPAIGTGIVHSVPSDSADDLIALYDLQKNETMCAKYGLNIKEIAAIKAIPVIEIPGYSAIPADDIIKKLGIINQTEREKLDRAKEILYKDGFYKGKLNSLYATPFSKNYSGKAVMEVKDEIKHELLASEYGDLFYQLSGKVIARSLAECVVKIVDDQWFIAYGNPEWKKLAHECLDGMKLYPENTRFQFNYVIDWLHNWACTREFGMGTRLPWDKKWLIESLSDSTVYMAYYTIAHQIKNIEPQKLTDQFFDYVFLGVGDSTNLGVSEKLIQELHSEFEYWYPMDFRNTGKDLIQNHMTFSIFNHTGIFPKKYWPQSFGLNGHVMVDGEKMSKSKGNFIIMREAYASYGADTARFTALSGGEGIDDANFDRELARSMLPKLYGLFEFVSERYGKGRSNLLGIDQWMLTKINQAIQSTTNYYEETLFRSAIHVAYFDLQNTLKWYIRRTGNNSNQIVMARFFEVQLLLLAPIIPFIAEELWQKMGRKEFISFALWPEIEGNLADDGSEGIIETTLSDIHSVIQLSKIEKPTRIELFIAEEWKYDLYRSVQVALLETRDFGAIMACAMKLVTIKAHGPDAGKIIQKLLKNGIGTFLTPTIEHKALHESQEFLKRESGAEVIITYADKSSEAKARSALPGKPAILVA